jgi:nanoRNase/pAp phosphatase (c-di-AMP/oligoRNAs hydrolase)
MHKPLAKSFSVAAKLKKLWEAGGSGGKMAILINADPDALASALALKRLFWRKIRQVHIYRINTIDRPDNLALVKLLDISHRHIRNLKQSEITKWALVDSQPDHNILFDNIKFNIIIDHHPLTDGLDADFIDVRPDYGAAATMMTEYLRAAQITPSPRLATALFYAIKTDTNNFIRLTTKKDLNAFRYLYEYANMNIVKKIESSEITRKSLAQFQRAFQRVTFFKHMAVVHMGEVDKPDVLVQVADFLLKLAEAAWSITSGIHNNRLIVIFRSAGFRRDAGKMAQTLFGELGSAGGHKGSARAEVPLESIECGPHQNQNCGDYVLKLIRALHKKH